MKTKRTYGYERIRSGALKLVISSSEYDYKILYVRKPLHIYKMCLLDNGV